ncbi:MAG: hypothetical protein M3O64_06240 [Chloroflexota bacterium]|nr:hypothetical protein [Chloroflexota bacterium]
MTDDRGQALVLAVLALGLAAATIVGLEAAGDRILRDAKERRAGEAAVEAAGAAVADAMVDLVASLRDARGNTRAMPTHDELEALVGDVLVMARAQAAADALSAVNGGGPVRDLEVRRASRAIEIVLSVGAHRQRAAIGTRCCLP